MRKLINFSCSCEKKEIVRLKIMRDGENDVVESMWLELCGLTFVVL